MIIKHSVKLNHCEFDKKKTASQFINLACMHAFMLICDEKNHLSKKVTSVHSNSKNLYEIFADIIIIIACFVEKFSFTLAKCKKKFLGCSSFISP